jgi:coatomer subunit beta
LQHPNEYVRGTTLRFLCKLREPELLEPLVPSVRSCLEHRHSYVRKNAVFAVFVIYKHFDYLLPDAPELIQTFLAAEADSTCKRNAFAVLSGIAPHLAVEWLKGVYASVTGMDEQMQLAIVELVRKDYRNNAAERARYLRLVTELLGTASLAVRFEAATTLTSLTQNPAAAKAAATTYIDLALKDSDNNVKLIVLERFDELRKKHDHTLDDQVMHLLRIVSSPDVDVKEKVLNITMELLSSRNVDEVIGFLKKELYRTQDQAMEKNEKYQQLLIQHIHKTAIKFPKVAAVVVNILLDFLGETSASAPTSAGAASAVDVISFVREVVQKLPELRQEILPKLLDNFMDLKSGRVLRGVLWILGEYCLDASSIQDAWAKIRESLGELPLLASEQRQVEEAQAKADTGDAPAASTSSRRILPDGTYATESALSTAKTSHVDSIVKSGNKPPLRSLLLNGDFFLGTVLASTVTKLALRYASVGTDARAKNSLRAEAMLIITGIVRIGRSPFPSTPIDEDSTDRIMICLRVLDGSANDKVHTIFTENCKAAFAKMVEESESKSQQAKEQSKANQSQVHDLIVFRQFAQEDLSVEDQHELELTKAIGMGEEENLMSRLSRVVQLTGFSDPVYAEAYVNVHQFDIFIDVLLVNQTGETLRNLTVEFATMGDLKLVEKPQQHNVGPHGFLSTKASIKVASTETGVIFGNIVYDGALASDSHYVIMNDIHIDIMDYIKPGQCTEHQFRSMWTEFEWENKVNVNTTIKNLRDYLQYIIKQTNMHCLTADNALSGDCDFLSANMYARSIFGEDALANVSIEKQLDGKIAGHVRIRSATQGIALSLGDKITLAQKNTT